MRCARARRRRRQCSASGRWPRSVGRAVPLPRARRPLARVAAPRAAAVRHRRRRRRAGDDCLRHRRVRRLHLLGPVPQPQATLLRWLVWGLFADGCPALLLPSCAHARCRRPSPKRGCRHCRRASARTSCSTASMRCCRWSAASPKRAEMALQDMADLFRVLMRDNRDLAPLADEVELCRQYLELEQLAPGRAPARSTGT